MKNSVPRNRTMRWALAASLLLMACPDKGPAERAGKKVDSAAQAAGEKVDSAARTVGDKMDDVAKDVGDAMK